MVKVLLAAFLFGLSFSGLANEEECDLEVGVERRKFSGIAYKMDQNLKGITAGKAKDRALKKCYKAGYTKCTAGNPYYNIASDNVWYYFRVEAVGERRLDLNSKKCKIWPCERKLELNYEERKRLLCERINQCIGNGKGSYEQLEALFKLNKCSE